MVEATRRGDPVNYRIDTVKFSSAEASAQRVFNVADQILWAGRVEAPTDAEGGE